MASFPSTYLVYIDDSRDERKCCFSALMIPVHRWRECFAVVKNFRKTLKVSDGIAAHSEFHAWKFVSGRGRLGANRRISIPRRIAIFEQSLRMIAALPDVRLINVCLDADKEYWAFERLLNRINTNMQKQNGYAMLICDEGKDAIYTRLARRMHVFNYIPSMFGDWGNSPIKNIPIERIVEDPFFKDSKRSYFVQLVDFCAYALLKQESPLPTKNALGLHLSFRNLHSICVKEASRSCPYGIVR